MPGLAVIAPPKSASTFVYQVLCTAGNFEPVAVPPLTIPSALWPYRRPIVHQHWQPEPELIDFLQREGLRPIIVRRDIADSIVSLREEWERQWVGDFERTMAAGFSTQFVGNVPSSFVEAFLAGSIEQQHQLTIDLALLWYCQFGAAWRRTLNGLPGFASVATYEEIARSPLPALSRLCTECGLDTDGLEDAIAKVGTSDRISNHNIGRPGRGAELLTLSQIEHIARMQRLFAI
jgi:hypothetical protein